MTGAIMLCLSTRHTIPIHPVRSEFGLNITSLFIHLLHASLLPPLLLGSTFVLSHLFPLCLLSPLLLPLPPHLLLHPPLPLPLKLALHALQQRHHLLGTEGAVIRSDAVSGRLLQRRAQRVVLEVQPLEVFQLRKADCQLLKPVCIEVEGLEGLEVTEVLRQLSQTILAQVQLRDVGEEWEVGRQAGQ